MRKFKCIKSYESGEWLTKGKIYTEDNGKFRYDDGWISHAWDYNVSHFDNGVKMSNYLEEVFDEEIKDDKKVSKFKVGDVVEIIGSKSGHCFNIGDIVELYEDCGGDFRGRTSKNETYGNHIGCEDMKLDRYYMIEKLDEYCYERNCDDCVFQRKDDEFDDMDDDELLEAYNLAFVTSKIFTITTSDTITTLTDGTHTTIINRYYTDKHDDTVALS